MKKAQRILSFLLAVSLLLLAVPVSAATVTDAAAAAEIIGKLDGKTVISWSDYYQHVTGTTSGDKGVLTRVTGAEGAYSTYIQYEAKNTTGTEGSHVLGYSDIGKGYGFEGNVASGDAMLLRMVIRAVGAEGKTKATTVISGVGTTSMPTGTYTIPTEWTEMYIPMVSGGAVNHFALRFGYYDQTVQIADLSLVNYGTATTKENLPSGSWSITPPAVGAVKGGTAVSTDMFPKALECLAGQTAFVDPIAAADGEMLLVTLPVRAKSVCSQVTVHVDMGGTDSVLTYYVPVQWSNLYLPVQCDGSFHGVSISVDSGCVQFGAATVENKGSATFRDLTQQSGMWVIEEYNNIILPESAGVKAKNEAFYAQAGIETGRTTDLVMSSDGKYVYSIGDGKLTVTDITDPANPVVLYKTTDETLGETRQICLLPGKGSNGADAVMFTCRIYGAYIFDMADPANPVKLAHYDGIEMSTGLAVYDDYAFLSTRLYGIEVVDISDVSNPKHLCTIMNDGAEIQSCKVVNGILYSGEYKDHRVTIYDVSDPVNYKKLGACNLTGRGDAMTVATVGGKTYLYAGTGHHSTSDLALNTPLSNLNYGQGNGLDIFDITDPANPVWLSTSRADGRFYSTTCDYWGAEYGYDPATGKSYAYLVSTFNGVYVYDVTDPKAPVRVAHVAMEILPDSANYSRVPLSYSGRELVYNFDTNGTNPTLYGAAGAVAVTDGVLCIAGASSDLYVLPLAQAFNEPAQPADAQINCSDYYHFDAFEDLKGYASATVENGQTYAVDVYNGYVYVAAGSQGIQIFDQDLKHLASVATPDICYDLYIQNGKLYSAEGCSGVVIYDINGTTLTETWRHVSTKGAVTTVRPSITGKFVALHVGSNSCQIVRVSDSKEIVNRGAGSQMYHHNVSELVAGRYIGFWSNSASERWYDFGENDSYDTPKYVTDVSAGYAPRCNSLGGLTAYGDQAMATGSGGYFLYDPESITADGMKALTMIKPVDNYGSSTKVNIYGRATIAGDRMVSCDRMYGRIYITDISDINNPVRLAAFGTREGTPMVGNPDLAKVVGNTVYIPLGYMGIVKFDLSLYKAEDVSGHYGSDHCLCNGNIAGHDCDRLTWDAWGDSEDELGSLPTSGNYYLATDITVSAETKVSGATLNLCLNGHTITTTGKVRTFRVSGGILNITDCKSGGTILGSTTALGSTGSMIYMDDTAANQLNIYAGTLQARATDAPNHGGVIGANNGVIHIYGGTICDGSVTSASGGARYGGNIYMKAGQLNISGGTIQNGTSTTFGGNIYMNTGTVLNISGGIIEGGVTTAENGGNIYLHTGTELNISGGIIRNGSAALRGFNVYAHGVDSKRATVNISGGSFLFDRGVVTSTDYIGGNLFFNYSNVTLTGGTIGDAAAAGDGVYFSRGTTALPGEGSDVCRMGGTITLTLDEGKNLGTTFVGGLTVENMTLAGILGSGAAYRQGGNVVAVTGTQTAITGGDVTVALGHDMTYVPGFAATCYAEGMVSHYVCSSCEGIFADEAGEEALSTAVIPKAEHTLVGGLCAVCQVVGDGTAYYKSLQEAIANSEAEYLTLNFDITEDVLVDAALMLDLNGKTLTGNVTVEGDAIFYLFDSATADYTAANRGKIVGNITGNICRSFNTPASYGHNYKYLTLQETDGSWSAHRYYLSVKSAVITPANATGTAVDYKTVFKCNELVAQYVTAYGAKLTGDATVYADAVAAGLELTAGINTAVTTLTNTLSLENSLEVNAANALAAPTVNAYIVIDGQEITSAGVTMSLQDLLVEVNGRTDLTFAEKAALGWMYAKFREVIDAWEVDLSAIKSYAW